MRRILSYLVLLMLFATSGYAAIPLTTAHWTGNETCQYVLFKSTGTAFGLETPNGSNYADLSNFSKLVLTVPEGQPRVFFNATGGGVDERLTVGPGVGTYMTKSGNTYTVDIERILADYGSAKLNSIKAATSQVELTVTSIQLVEKGEKTWDFSNWSTALGSAWTSNNDANGSWQGHAYVTSGNNGGELCLGGTGSNGNTSYYTSIINETKGLIFSDCSDWRRININTVANKGVSVRALSITIPNLKGGYTVKFYTDNNSSNTIESDGNDVPKDANGIYTYQIPNTYSTESNIKFDFGGGNAILINKIEVTKTHSIYFSDVSIGGESGKQSDFRNNILSVTPHNLNEPTSFKFVLKDANGENTITTPVDPSNFEISSSDANVIDVSVASVSEMSSGNYKYEITGVKLNPGTAYLTVRYGNITETHPINIAKIPVYIRGKGSNVYTKHANDGAWWVNFYVSPIGSTETLEFDSKDYFSQSAFKLWSGAVNYNGDGYTPTKQYDVKITPAHTGTEIIIIKLRNHPLYEDCDAEFPLTILKNKQVISYPQDWTFTYDEAESHNLRNELNNLLNTDLSNPNTHTNITVNNGIWTYTPSGKQITFKSSDTNVLTVDANTGKITWTGNSGTATITATVAGDDNWAPAEASFTLTVNGTVAGPRLIWLTYYNTYTWNMVNTGRGSSYGWYWFKTREQQELDLDGHTVTVSYTNEKNNVVPYNQDQWFQAIALRSDVTDEELKAAGFKEYPYKNNMHDYWYYIAPDGGPRYFNDPIAPFLYGDGTDPNVKNRTHNSKIVYTIDVPLTPDGMRWVTTVQQNEPANTTGNQYVVNYDDGSAHWYGSTDNQSNYGALLHVGSTFSDSLTVTATYPGNGNMNPSTTYNRFWVQSSEFGFSFQPDEGVVNKDHWIIPYVKFPDLKLIDFKNIWVTIDNEVAVSVEGADDMYSLANIKNPSTGQPYGVGHEADAVAAIQACTSEATLKTMLGGYFDYFKLKHDETLGWMIEGIYPKIWGLTVGEEADVTIHIEGYGGTFADAEATYHVTVVDVNDDLFHWEMNDKKENPSDPKGHDDKQIKTIYMVEGDYIYMPGIVGNPNGNDDYSKEGSYKYLYGIQEGDIVMNFKPYFWREGIANYFFTYNYESTTNGYSKYKPSSERLIPTTNTRKDAAPEALIFWASGLGNYYRNDSLLIYANKKTDNPIYLWAEDPQTGNCCTPIKIQIFSRESLVSERQESLKDMTYPFTWDFEHMNLSGLEEIKQDAHNGYYYTNDRGEAVYGNGGTYWRKRWDSSGGSTLRSPHGIDKKYYQYNGVFNADYDDKDDNYTDSGYDQDGKKVSGSRQRWFKDLSANGTYLDMFKGLRLNIAGLDYWEQKYTRFNVATEPSGGIYFEGGVHYLSLPGFGVNGSAIITDATRERGSLPMPGSQVHFNTNDNNCTKDYFNRGYNGNADAGSYTHANILNTTTKRNNRVYFVIKAEGNSDKSVIYVGGRKMMMKTNSNTPTSQIGIGTGTQIGENGTLYSDGLDHDNTHKISLTTSKKVYIIPLDPWDDDFQEQIYLAMDKGVHIYWMGISTEPRDLRDDYETYAYSYPVDLDMEKTNEVMTMLTEQDYGTAITMKPYYGSGYNHARKSLIVSEYPLDDDYKVAKDEGLQFYPSVRLHDVSGLQAKLPSKTVANKTVLKAVVDADGKPVYNANGTYRFEPVTYDYTYHYLPTYFIANAQNMNKTNYKNNVGGRGKATTLNEKNAPTSANPAILEKEIQYEDGTTKTVPTYNKFNRLTDASYSVFMYKDYYSQDGTMPTENDNGIANKGASGYYHFIPLGIINEYIKRYLAFDDDNDYKVITEYLQGLSSGGSEAELKPGRDLEDLPQNDNGEFDDVVTKQYYYDLIGPGVVRYYRANNNNYMKGRRSYLKLTWQEYQVNTYGKAIDGASTGSEATNSSGDTNPIGAGEIGDPDVENTSSQVQGVKIMFANSFADNDDDVLVSEDGGFPDGIEEVKQDTDNGAFYNLNGTRVTTPRKGVYIHNGKKIIIK